nr:hypothetical protein [Tanacetum cinerariifolium]
SVSIDHVKACRSLADVALYNPIVEEDFNFALQRLCEVYFSLLFELSSYKDASVMDIMDLLRLESPFADAPKMSDLQPDVEHLMLPIHRLEDQVALVDVWVPLVDPLSAKNLMGAADTSVSVLVTVATMTTLSTTFASATSVTLITIEDNEIAGTDGQKDA